MSETKASYLFFFITIPFGNHETFIESEITYLLVFKRIIIISHDLNTKYKRSAKNVEVFRVRYTPSLKEKLFQLDLFLVNYFGMN